MRDIIQNLKKKFLDELNREISLDSLENLKNQYLGRKGELTQLLRQLKDLAVEERKEIGNLANKIKKELEEELAKTYSRLVGEKSDLAEDRFDVTQSGIKPNLGSIHPVTAMTRQIWQAFEGLNFKVIAEGPEIEDDYHCFAALNMPKDHPARDMQDTFYLLENYVLRTHTSSMQIRYMENNPPPVRIVVTGKCYRRDSDATHSPMFSQFEGLCIDKNITMSDLRGVLKAVVSKILEKDIDTRFRISYFPFVEPGAEFDVTCTMCEGKGCSTCKGAGWLELGGCGMVHPNVLKNVGYDPKEWQGFAFGFGIERPFMIKHQVNDLRLFFENDLRFLKQF